MIYLGITDNGTASEHDSEAKANHTMRCLAMLGIGAIRVGVVGAEVVA